VRVLRKEVLETKVGMTEMDSMTKRESGRRRDPKLRQAKGKAHVR
jgi:hypothetical protein